MGQADNAERRQLTVLFCDLVGSTPLSSAMDPEDLNDLTRAFLDDCVAKIEGAGGYVARFEGDGILAYFGYPAAHEDAAQRAIHAALAIRDAERPTDPDQNRLRVRVGVATGVVVVGDLISAKSTQERTVTGLAPNLAKRVQSLAAPDAILVSEATKRLAEGVFEFKSLGEVQPKGMPFPTPVWEVVGPRATISRYEGRRAVGVSPLMGRETELASILRAWEAASSGNGRIVGLVGDPGIGKSRLVEEARRIIGEKSEALWLEGGGASIHDNTPFHVVVQFAGQSGARQWSENGSPWEFAETVNDARDETIRAVAERIWSAATRTPTVIIVEDLHWVDPSSLELLAAVMAAETAPILMIYTTRVEVDCAWPADRHEVIRLGPFDDAASASLARWRAGGNLGLGQIDSIVSQSAGVPLYIEELTRWITDRGYAADHELPSSLADLLAERLEGLGPVRGHAQTAAVLGHEFPSPLFAVLSGMEEDAAEQTLGALVDAEVLVRREGDASPVYAFRHTLIAKAAYDSLLVRRRHALHARTAETIVEHFPNLARSEPQMLARHWAAAGETRKAIDNWESAGDFALARRAFREAEHAYRCALSLLAGIDIPDSERQEIRLQAAFARVLQVTQGYTSEEAARSSDRVRELAARIGADETLVREELLRWRSVFTAGDYAQAEIIADTVMVLTESQPDAPWRRAFRLRAGIQHGFYTGDLARGERDYLEWSEGRALGGFHRGPGDDVLSIGIAALIAAIDGQHGVARQRLDLALETAEARGPYDLAMALHIESGFHRTSSDTYSLARSAQRLAAVAQESGFEFADHLATGWLAIVDANQGRPHESLERAGSAIAGFDRLKARASLMLWYGVLGRALWLNGDAPGALEAFAKALAPDRQERIFRPEVLRERAAVLSRVGRKSEATRDLREAESGSRRMGACLFEVRTLVDLGRLQLSNGDLAGSRDSLDAAQGILRSRPDLCPAERDRVANLAVRARMKEAASPSP